MTTQHLISTYWSRRPGRSAGLECSGPGSVPLVHLSCVDTSTDHQQPHLDAVLTLSQLAGELGVSVQTLYDLRSQGRGPRGFRVGRELRFRVREIDAWLVQLEDQDVARHPAR